MTIKKVKTIKKTSVTLEVPDLIIYELRDAIEKHVSKLDYMYDHNHEEGIELLKLAKVLANHYSIN